jgi:hypothetical protein
MLELTPTLIRFLSKLPLLEQRRAIAAKLPLLLGRPPRALREEKPSRLRPGLALVAKALPASFRRNGCIMLPGPGI